jgi:hypothetical protein
MRVKTWLEVLLSGLATTSVSMVAATAWWVLRKLFAHDTALALLVAQVNPPGDKSLREILHDIQLEEARRTIATQMQQGNLSP